MKSEVRRPLSHPGDLPRERLRDAQRQGAVDVRAVWGATRSRPPCTEAAAMVDDELGGHLLAGGFSLPVRQACVRAEDHTSDAG